MAEHDYVIDNQSAPAFRTDLNNALMAIVSQNSKATEPTTTYGNMIWYDTTNNQIKKRNETNSAWITLGTVDEGAGTFTPSGERALASQAQAEAGTDNATVMTPLRVAQAIDAQASPVLTFSSNVATTSGSNFDFTGIPSYVREIEIYWQNVSLTDGNDPGVQLIVGGTPVTSGYQSSSSSSGADSTNTSLFHMYNDSGGRYHSGIMRIVRAASGVWVETHSTTLGGGDASGGGWISGVGTVDGIRVTCTGGSFDQGNVSISYR